MDPTHNVGTFLWLLEWFSEAQLLYLMISNNKEVVWFSSDTCKKQIICNYTFELFEDEIHNVNQTRFSDFHTYAEAKIYFILAKERKYSKMNKSSDTRIQNTIVLERLKLEMIKLKITHRRKITRRVIITLAVIKIIPEVRLLRTGRSLHN